MGKKDERAKMIAIFFDSTGQYFPCESKSGWDCSECPIHKKIMKFVSDNNIILRLDHCKLDVCQKEGPRLAKEWLQERKEKKTIKNSKNDVSIPKIVGEWKVFEVSYIKATADETGARKISTIPLTKFDARDFTDTRLKEFIEENSKK